MWRGERARVARGPLSDRESAQVVLQCADGLSYLHGQGCIHRDVKPDNILVVQKRHALGDLGIVKWSDLNAAFTGAATITKSSIQLGSWYYMAPEQLASPHEAAFASDIYALGISWIEMLTCTKPDPATVGAGDSATRRATWTSARLYEGCFPMTRAIGPQQWA